MVKCLLIADFTNVDEVLCLGTLANIKGNLNTEVVVALLGMQNSKGLNPLLAAVERGDMPIFKLIWELSLFLAVQIKKGSLVIDTFNTQDIKGENALLKSVRISNSEMAMTMLT